MKRLKLLFAAAVALCLLALPVFGAWADVIDEPPYNAFYEENSGACTDLYENYITNGPKGKTEVYWSPGDDYVLASFGNGESHMVHCTYERDGELWGMVGTNEHAAPDEDGAEMMYYSSLNGWVRMSEMVREDTASSAVIIAPQNDKMPAGLVVAVVAAVLLVAAGAVVLVRVLGKKGRTGKK